MNKRFRNQIEKEIQEVQRYTETLQPPWTSGYLIQLEFLRVSLHKSLTSRKKDKRSEDLKLWEQLVGLIRERRELIMEYEELMAAHNEDNGG